MAKKVVSEKQLSANRKNAGKSTGPKTPQGKARACRNNLKHGLLARDVVISGTDLSENRAEFDAFLGDLCKEIRPHGLIEQTLVERIATCYWRLRRVQRFEVGAIRGTLDTADPAARAVAELRGKLADAEHALNLERRLFTLLAKSHDQRTLDERAELEHSIRDFSRVHRLDLFNAIAKLGADPGAQRTAGILPALQVVTAPPAERTAGILPASRAACVGSPCASNPARPAGAPAATSPGDAHRTEPPPGNSPDAKEVANADAIALENQVQSVMSAVISELEGKVTDLRTKLGAAETEHNRVAARRPFIASLPDRDALLRVVRYETMLDRQIHRALAELRRIRQVPLRDTRKKRTLRFEPI